MKDTAFNRLRAAFNALVGGISRSNAAHNDKVLTRQVVRAALRRNHFLAVGPQGICDMTRKERRQLARAKAAGWWNQRKLGASF